METLFNLDFSRWDVVLMSLFPALLNFGIFIYICLFLTQNRTNFSFAVFVLLMGFFQMADGFVRMSINEEIALQWFRISGIFALFVMPFGILFTIRFIGKRKETTNRFVLISQFLPTIVFLLPVIARLDEYTIKKSETWYWIISPQPTITTTLIYFWVSFQALVMLALLWWSYFKNKTNKTKHRQLLLIAAGFTVPVIIGIIAEALFPLVIGIDDRPFITPLLTLFSIASLIAIKKYSLLDYSPRHQWNKIIESMSEGIIITDNEYRIKYANKIFCELVGYSFAEIKEKTVYTVFTGESKQSEKIKQAIEKAKNENSYKYEVQFKTKTGEKLWMIASVSEYLDRNGEVIGWIGILTNISHQKQVIKKLEKSEIRLNEAQAISHIGNWEADFGTMITNWSDEVFKIYGVKKEETSPSLDAILSFVHPDDSNHVNEIITQSMATLQNCSFSNRIIRKDGAIRHLYFECHYEINKHGKPIRIYGIVQDVTEKYEADEKLKHNELKLKEAQRIAHVGSWELSFTSGIALWSEEALRIYGLSPEENQQSFESWISFIHPEDLDLVTSEIKKSQETFSDSSMFHRIIRKDGIIRHIHSISKFEFNSKGKPIGLFGIVHDVTDQKMVEKELENKELKYRSLIEQASDAILIANEAGEIKEINTSAIDLFGYSAEEFLNLTFSDLIFKEDMADKPLRYSKLQFGGTERCERWLKTKDGNPVEVDISIKAISDGRILAFVRDITALKKIEKKVFMSEMIGQEKERKRLSKELHDGLGQMLVGASLQLGNVKHFVDKKCFDTVPDKLVETDILLSNIIKEMRNISHNMSPHLLEELGLASAMKYICDSISQDNSISLSFSSTLHKKMEESIEIVLYRIFQELITNILKHSKATKASIYLSENKYMVNLVVEDDGEGLAKDKEKNKFSGLGLRTVKNRINLLQGSLKIKSKLGKGTKIEISIPVFNNV